jgi:ABC-type Na+ efflux pump permease subunit
MTDLISPYIELAKDAGIALTDAGYAYSLLVAAAPLLTVAGLVVLVGLIATHGKSHGTRFSAMAVFALAGLSGACAWLLRPEAAEGTMLQTMLTWSWVPPLLAAFALLGTMPERPKPRAIGLLAATAVALLATCYGGMLSIANQRALHPDDMAWLDATPMPQQPEQEVEEPVDTRPVLDTAAHR